jgi:hypothetical protein
LASKHRAISSNSSTAKNNNKERSCSFVTTWLELKSSMLCEGGHGH